MDADERARYARHQRLEQVLGPAEAATLMTLVPPVGWGEVATKRDLAEVEARLNASMREVEARLIATVHETIHTSMLAMNRSTVLAVVGSVLGSTTLSLAVTRLGG